MQRIFSSIKQVVRKSILIFSMLALLSLSGLFIVSAQPSLAATPNQKIAQQRTIDKDSQSADNEKAYEEQIEAEKNPEKVYEENVKEYKAENPGEGLVEKTVEGAEKLVDKVTGKK